MADSLIAAEDLTVERGGRIVLSHLSFTLAAGETMRVSGRNGTGKSTLLRTLAGLLLPTAGHVAYGRADDEVRGVETVHYLGYDDALKPSLTVGENLTFWSAMLAGASARRPAPSPASAPLSPVEALAAYGIARLLDLPAAYLSAGQKRRVALARLLLAPRPIWLLDEPLIALDTAAQAEVVARMSAHVASGGAILVASHQPLPASTRRITLGDGANATDGSL